MFLYLLNISLPFHFVWIAVLGCLLCRLEVCGSSLLCSLLPVGGVGQVACQGFLIRGACVCVLVGGAGSLLKCSVVSSSEFWGVCGFGWLWAACLLMLRAVVLLCWRISMVCLALELVVSWVELGLSVGIEALG